MQDAGIFLAVVGLAALLAFAQTSRRHMFNKLSSFLGLLTIPLFVAAVWRLALVFGWWTILVFVVVSLVVGTVNGVFGRRQGVATVYSMQPWVGLLSLICIAASWLLY